MNKIDVYNCESEPIRFPGSIMPFGALLVLEERTHRIEAASETCDEVIGYKPESLFGQTLDKFFGADADAALASARGLGLGPVIHFSLADRELKARLGINEAGQVLVDIERAERDSSSIREMIYDFRRDLTKLRRLTEVSKITQGTAELVRAITGYDRVMIYRFDEAWNGEVVAESHIEGIEPFLGLNYPASDIPKQARDLFQINKLRLISEVFYTPVTLLARNGSPPIDLGQSSLRSVSPIHIEYLKNMGVRATLVGALVVEGRLWGLLSCQHLSGPLYFGPTAREALEWLCEDIATLIEMTEIRQRREREYRLANCRRRLVEAIGLVDFKSFMQHGGQSDLLDVVGADGFALIAENTVETMGYVPETSRILELHRQRFKKVGDGAFFASNCLAHDLELEESGDGVAGGIFVSLREKQDLTMIWFRKERHFSVRWAGDPQQSHIVDESGRISPRKSFVQFLQNIRGQCLPWDAQELGSATELGTLIEIEIQHRLRAERDALQTVLSRLNEAIRITEPRSRDGGSPKILWVSPAFEKLSGYKSNELRFQEKENLFGSETTEADDDVIWETLAKGVTYRAEILCNSKNGNSVWIERQIFPVLDDKGKLYQVISIERDITERKKQDDDLRKLFSAVEQTSASVIISDSSGNIEYVNPHFYNISGRVSSEVIGKHVRSVMSEHMPKETIRTLFHALQEGLSWSGEIINQNKNGEFYWEDSHVAPIKDRNDVVTHYVAVNTDITERKKLEKTLSEEEAFNRTILQSIPEHMAILDPRGTIISVNAAWKRFAEENGASDLANYSIGLNYRNYCMTKYGEDADNDGLKAWAGIESVLTKKSDFFTFDYPCDSPHERRWFKMTVSPMLAPREGVIVAHENITQRKLLEENLRYSNIELDQFASAVSHDLRQPLSMVRSYLALIERNLGSKPAGEVMTFLKYTIASATHMDEMISGVLEYARSDQLEIVEVSISKIVTDVLNNMKLILNESDADVIVADHLPVLNADPQALSRLFENLVGNAIKYRCPGRPPVIEIGGCRQPDDYLLWVKDNGVGISQKNLERIFIIFQRLVPQDAAEGSGIGLAICKKVVERHGGKIWAESVPGIGSTFFMTFPVLDEKRPDTGHSPTNGL